MSFSVAPPSPYSLWAGELRQKGEGPWSSPRKSKASMTGNVCADSPVKKAVGTQRPRDDDDDDDDDDDTAMKKPCGYTRIPLRLGKHKGGGTGGKGSGTHTEGGVTTGGKGNDAHTEGGVTEGGKGNDAHKGGVTEGR